MTVIAIDRYQAFINPLNKRITTSVPTRYLIAIIWTASVVFAIPNAAFNRIAIIQSYKPIQRCQTVYPEPKLTYRRNITLFTFLTQYAIPLSITAFAYIRISLYIWGNLRHPIGNKTDSSLVNGSQDSNVQKMFRSSTLVSRSSSNYPSNTHRERSRRRSIKMLAIVVGVFSICWLPLNVYHIYTDFFNSSYIMPQNLFLVCHWIAMSSVCYNPFIYFWLNRRYRQEVKHLTKLINLSCLNRNHFQSIPKPTVNKKTCLTTVLRDEEANNSHTTNENQSTQTHINCKIVFNVDDNNVMIHTTMFRALDHT